MIWQRRSATGSSLGPYCWWFLGLFVWSDASVYGRLAADVRHTETLVRRDASGLVFQSGTPDTTSCNSASTCLSVASCAPAQINPSDFKICGWDAVMPLVCCPATAAGTDSTPAPLRSQDPVPVAECAKLKLDGGTLIPVRKKRTEKAYGSHLGFAVSPDFNQRHFVKADFRTSVVGGKSVTAVERWPFMVGIYVKLSPRNSFLCGGSLISKNTVLTAAHCFQSSQPGDVYVIRLSQLKLNDATGVSGVTEFETSRVVVHPDFRPPSFYNDIALVKIDGVSTFSDTLRPVCLAGAGETEGGPAHVIGWGAKETGGGFSNDLQEVGLSLVANSDCNKTYMALDGSDITFQRGIAAELLCAGNVGRPTDACQGDSGGPLVKINPDMTFRQIGVVAGGHHCGELGTPGIYTRVSHYREWIATNLS